MEIPIEKKILRSKVTANECGSGLKQRERIWAGKVEFIKITVLRLARASSFAGVTGTEGEEDHTVSSPTEGKPKVIFPYRPHAAYPRNREVSGENIIGRIIFNPQFYCGYRLNVK